MEVAHSSAHPASPKRILYVITKSNWGGAQRYVYDLATEAKNAGHTVLVASGREGELTDRLREAGVAVSPIPSMQRDVRLSSDLKVFGELSRILKEFKPDVVHGNSSKAGALTALVARLHGVRRVVFTAHGWAFNENRPVWQKILIGGVHYATIILSDVTICNSEATKRDTRYMPFVASKLRVVHHGVHPFALRTRADARTTLAPDFSAHTWVGVIAELHPVKGLDVLIQAIEHVLPDYADLGLVIIGEGEERGYLEHLLKIQGVRSRTILIGHVQNAPEYLSAFDIFVLPSRSESLGYVLLEAGFAGLPCVATNVGGIPEIIENNVTGILVPPNNPEALTTGIETLLKDEVVRARMAKALKERVETQFTPERMVHQTFALYEKNS